MSVLKIKDENTGEFIPIPSIKGDTGDAAGFGTVSATVDANHGTPSVTVTASGEDTAKNFAFEFKNLQPAPYDDSVLVARMDSFTNLAEGSTTGDAELIDGRTGADGVTYTNIGSAIRGQVTDLKSELNVYSYANVIGNIKYFKYPVYLKKNASITFGTVDGTNADYDIAVYLYNANGTQLDYFNLLAGSQKRTVNLNLSADVYFIEVKSTSTKDIYLVVGKTLGEYYPYFGNPRAVKVKLEKHDADITILERMNANQYGKIDLISDIEVGAFTAGVPDPVGTQTRRLRSAEYHEISDSTILFKFYNTSYQIAVEEYNANKDWIKESSYLSNLGNITYTCSGNCKYIKLLIKAIPDVIFTVTGVPEMLNFTAEYTDKTITELTIAGITVNKDNSVISSASLKSALGISDSVSSKIKVMSYNVGLYTLGVNRDWTDADDASITRMRQILSEQNCDVLGITEARPTIKSSTDKAQIYDYLYPDSFESTSLGGSGIFSRFAISNYNTAQFSTGRTYRYATLNVNGTEVFFLLLHLSPDWTGYREQEVTETIALMNNHEYFIACGDFNAGNDTGGGLSEYEQYIEEGFHLASGGYLGGLSTYSNNRYLDNIITSDNIIMCNSYVPTVDNNPSDHLPIIAELQLT